MGSAVSAVTGAVNGITNSLSGGSLGSFLTNPVGTISTGLGSGVGNALGGVAQGIANIIPDVPIADQSAVQQQIDAAASAGSGYQGQVGAQQGQANAMLNAATSGINTSQNAINQTQGSINNAQYINQGIGSNVNNAIGLIGQTASGSGAAQQAAAAQLQAGTNQAIQTQQAMANSGNLSQMIGGQRTAMQDAAQLQQQNALNAASLQANMAATAQGQYTGAAAQQATQAAQNAGLQQQQATQQQAQQQAQQNLYSTAQNAAASYGNLANTAEGNALTGQTNALGIQQTALGQTGQNKALAVGGVLNMVGGATNAGVAALSDEDSKTAIEYASGPRAGLSLYDSNSNVSSQQSYEPQPQEQTTQPKSQFNYFGQVGKGNVPVWTSVPLSSDSNGKYDVYKESDSSDSLDSAATQISKSFAGSDITMSDKRSKEAVRPGDENKIKSFLDAIDPVSFKYKQPDGQMGKTPGEHLGVIAQQVEKAPHGQSMILDTQQGKAIDTPSAVGALLAAAADLNDRLSSIEDYFKSRKEKK